MSSIAERATAPVDTSGAAPARPTAAFVVQPVVMAGGSGTRLWPLSRGQYPKQFLSLAGEETLFQQAVRRMTELAGAGLTMVPPVIVGNEGHRFMLLDQLREAKLSPAAVLLEPAARNTAPALTLAALQAIEGGADPVLVVTPADQAVTDGAAYRDALARACEIASQGGMVILGIVPERPETGYGYIRATEPAAQGAFVVERFVEKPDPATAAAYLAAGGYYWNSGIFVMRASTWLAALAHHQPAMDAGCRGAWAARQPDGAFVRPGKAEFAQVESDSIDYAVIEHSPGSAWPLQMLPLQAGWTDLGAWDAVWQIHPKDAHGNVTQGDVMLHDAHDSFVHASERLVSVVGLDNVVVIETADAVMVTDRSRSQDVKKIVSELGQRERGEHNLHRKVHRPWGWYDSIDAGARFQVKRIMVKPGASLSLQMHHHRAEHWIVVTGTAEVTCGDKVLLLSENQSTYIPLGETHRLRNPGKVPLELIEVQSGSYLGEDDIVRFEDVYGRG